MANRITILFLALLLTACIPTVQAAQDSQDVPQVNLIATTPSIIATDTPIPTETIGYHDTEMALVSTADSAIATANEASRINAQITAEYEQRVQEQLAITAAADQMYFQMAGWTQTAAQTTIPLTATQQAIINTQVADEMTLQAGIMTATAQAPTMAIIMADAENYAQYKQIGEVVGWVFQILVGLALLLGVILTFILLFRKLPQAPEAEPEDEQKETVIWVGRNGNTSTTTRYAFPCSPEQLTELATLIVNGERTLGINRLPLYALFAVALISIDRGLMTYKCVLLLRARGIRLPFFRGLMIYCASWVWGLFLSTTVGSDAIRAYCTSRDGIDSGEVVSSIIIERFLGFLSAILLAILSLVLLTRIGHLGDRVGLAWVLCQPFPTFPLIGPRQISETRACAAALDVPYLLPGAKPGAWSHIYRSDRVIGGAIWAALDEPFYFKDRKRAGYAWVM